MLDIVEERLDEMTWPDPVTGSIDLGSVHRQAIAAMRRSIAAWYEAEYRPAHPNDPTCVHGLVSCEKCRHYSPIKFVVTAEQLAALGIEFTPSPPRRRKVP